MFVTLNLFQGLSLLKFAQKFFAMFISIISSDAKHDVCTPHLASPARGEEFKKYPALLTLFPLSSTDANVTFAPRPLRERENFLTSECEF